MVPTGTPLPRCCLFRNNYNLKRDLPRVKVGGVARPARPGQHDCFRVPALGVHSDPEMRRQRPTGKGLAQSSRVLAKRKISSTPGCSGSWASWSSAEWAPTPLPFRRFLRAIPPSWLEGHATEPGSEDAGRLRSGSRESKSSCCLFRSSACGCWGWRRSSGLQWVEWCPPPHTPKSIFTWNLGM